ncbi:MAG TPA: ribosomal protein S18-alanine N-acetyltransferase [Vicinamibacterales bacterium]|nr:ribosomal protein S18-alanine N-acetyltransferase [Vicinamibacterales bacterium]
MSRGAPSVSVLGKDDLEAVLAIDAESFLRPWTRHMYEAELANTTVTRIFGIAIDGRIVGYCASWVLPGELHINNLAVLPDYRRQGLARALLAEVLAEAGRLGCTRATLEVRRSNHAARQLYEGIGFSVHGVRRDYYSDPVEDALILWLDRGTPSGP